jgi:hypothetical protein
MTAFAFFGLLLALIELGAMRRQYEYSVVSG